MYNYWGAKTYFRPPSRPRFLRLWYPSKAYNLKGTRRKQTDWSYNWSVFFP